MQSIIPVAVHSSLLPDRQAGMTVATLRQRQVDPKLHYVSHKQARHWLAVHQKHSPARTDDQVQAAYRDCFESVCEKRHPHQIEVVSLGCGSGHKDEILIRELLGRGIDIHYIPADISLPLVLSTQQRMLRHLPPEKIRPLLCDLTAIGDDAFALLPQDVCPRLIALFGMLPGFNPDFVLPLLRRMLRPQDRLLLSANLMPDLSDESRDRILAQYDNPETRQWLDIFLTDHGFPAAPDSLTFGFEEDASGNRRIAARLQLNQPRKLTFADTTIDYESGDELLVFFSYRSTADEAHDLFARHGLKCEESFLCQSGEEGVYSLKRRD